jgi:hypothetical protein
MSGEVFPGNAGELTSGSGALPGLIVRAGASAEKHFIEFFAAQIRDRNTRATGITAGRNGEARVGGNAEVAPTSSRSAPVPSEWVVHEGTTSRITRRQTAA